MWPWLWPWPWIFKIKYGINYILVKNDLIATKQKNQAYLLNPTSQMWPWGLTLAVTLTLNFQGQIWNQLYLSQNGPIDTKQKTNISIELYASNVTIWFDLPRDLDLGFSRSNMEFASSQPKMVWLSQNVQYIYRLKGLNDHQVGPCPWLWKLRCKDQPDSERGEFRCRCAANSSSYVYVSVSWKPIEL